MVVAHRDFEDVIARAFDGALLIDGVRVIAHKSGTHCIRVTGEHLEQQRLAWDRVDRTALDRDNNWSDV